MGYSRWIYKPSKFDIFYNDKDLEKLQRNPELFNFIEHLEHINKEKFPEDIYIELEKSFDIKTKSSI